ncbi:MAG: hypothetical protein WC554_09235 [Clostridia bacterium]
MIKSIYQIKPTVSLFLLGQLLDSATTLIGVNIGITETNVLLTNLGWTGLFILKWIIALLISVYIQFRINKKWIEWAFVIAASAVVPWNIYCIICKLLGVY